MAKNKKNLANNTNESVSIMQADQGIWGNSISPLQKAAERDAFGRFRISQPYTLFDSSHRYRDNGKFDTRVAGAGSTTQYLPNESAINLVVGIGSTCEVVRETKRVFPYQPGKSLLIMNTFVMNTPKANLRQRVGYFGAQNGVFFEVDGLNKYFVLRSYTDGSISERRIDQMSWNGHKFDGSDFAQRNLDITKGNILWFDVEWLGVGDVRCGFVIDGDLILAHTFHNDNLYSTTYMTTANLPIRYEITNTAGTASTSTMKQICSTVISEGGFEARGIVNHASTSLLTASLKDLGSPGTRTPLVSLRLKSTNLDAIVLPIQVDIMATSNDLIRWELVSNPTTLTGTGFTSYSNSSNVEVDINATAVTGGTILNSGYIYQKDAISLGGTENFNFQIGRFLSGSSEIVTLVASSNGTNTKVAAGIGFYDF